LKYLICFGTRPEVIKMAPIILEMERRGLQPVLCTTGQHREMLDQMLQVFNLEPHYDLDLMKAGQSLNSLSAEIFKEIDNIFDYEKPDVVLVQGDTTTANIIAQAAFYRKIAVGHIEAGLRTYQRYSPFPEEINRQLISRIATWHFTPTKKANENLLSEGIKKEAIVLTGNTVIDALKMIESELDAETIPNNLGLKLTNFKKMILVTGHRRENFGKGIQELCTSLLELAKNKKLLIVFPVHLNPRTKTVVEERLKEQSNIRLLPPVNYPEMVWLISNCDLIISDSGGIQEEAPTFKKPVLVTRNYTEREEAVEAGFSILTGSNSQNILSHAFGILKDPPNFQDVENPFGDGNSAKRIVDFLEKQATSTGVS